jgi:hypothetical protein
MAGQASFFQPVNVEAALPDTATPTAGKRSQQ